MLCSIFFPPKAFDPLNQVRRLHGDALQEISPARQEALFDTAEVLCWDGGGDFKVAKEEKLGGGSMMSLPASFGGRDMEMSKVASLEL